MMGVGVQPQGGNRSQGGGGCQNEASSMGGYTEVGSHGSPGSLATGHSKHTAEMPRTEVPAPPLWGEVQAPSSFPGLLDQLVP